MGVAELFGVCMVIGAVVGAFMSHQPRERRGSAPPQFGHRGPTHVTNVYIVGSQVYVGDPQALRALRELEE